MNYETLALAFGAAVITNTPAPIPDLSQGFTLGVVIQLVMLIIGVGGAIFGLHQKFVASRQGEQTIEKTKFDSLVQQNEQHIRMNRRQRAAAERYWIARELLLRTAEGHEILRKTEEIADSLELPEIDPNNQ